MSSYFLPSFLLQYFSIVSICISFRIFLTGSPLICLFLWDTLYCGRVKVVRLFSRVASALLYPVYSHPIYDCVHGIASIGIEATTSCDSPSHSVPAIFAIFVRRLCLTSPYISYP